MDTSARYVADLVELGHASVLPQLDGSQIDKRLCDFPWIGSHIAWHQIENTSCFEWGAASDLDAANFLLGLRIGNFKQVVAFYGLKRPVLLFNSDWLFKNLDVASVNTQQYFLFGYENSQVKLETFSELEVVSTIWGWNS